MRTIPMTMIALIAGLITTPSHAKVGAHGLPETPALYTCANGGRSRVALAPDPAPCCTGAFGCPQLLSNTGLIKPRRDNHT